MTHEVWFALLAGLTVAAARRITTLLFPAESRELMAIRTAVLAFAIVVACGLLLGWIGRLSLAGYLVTEGILCAALLAVRPSRAREAVPGANRDGIQAWIVGVVGALAAFAAAFAIGHAPLTLYDAVSYHLHFAARWLQEGKLFIVPTPFSDPAQAYAPANGELWFVWLMAPFHGDTLARFGQFPFAGLGALLVYVLARRLGAPPRHAIYPAVFFLVSRPILEQAVGADVDLICAVMFLAAVYFGFAALERDRARDWMFWGLAVGLYAGTKYVALVYLPVLMVLALLRGPRRRALWALVGVAMFAAPWYVRNWIVAGSPIYPASLQMAGVTLAEGAFTRAAMMNTAFHSTDVRVLPTLAARAFGPTLLVAWLPLAVYGALRLVRRGLTQAFVTCMPLAMALLFWFGFPVNVDPRFFMPAVAPALLPLAFVFRGDRRWDAAMHIVYGLAIAWIIVGANVTIEPATPWFMKDWWLMNGLVAPTFLAWFAALAVMTAVVWRFGRVRRWALPIVVCMELASASVLAAGADSWCGATRCEYLTVTDPYIRGAYRVAWLWTREHIANSTIAYTGINLPYPLAG